jgi:hypothetical protein
MKGTAWNARRAFPVVLRDQSKKWIGREFPCRRRAVITPVEKNVAVAVIELETRC